MELYLGIDGGGTRTRARLQDPVRDATYGAALNALSFAKKTIPPDFPNK